MKMNQHETKWSANVILVDADYLDNVARNLIERFERLLGRQIAKGSMTVWADCVALDGGLRPGDNQIQVVIIHPKEKRGLNHLDPSDFAEHLSGKAFKDNIGEFVFDCYPAEEEFVDYDDFFVDALQLITAQKEVKRLMVVTHAENALLYNKVREVLNGADDEKAITIFSMQPATDGESPSDGMQGKKIRQEILGYSLMAALGIKAEEIENKIE
jgi:hypothetical protein